MKMTEKAMIGGCCICSVETGFENNPIVYCDGENCNLGVHQACYSIKSVPEGSWYCDVCKLGIDSVVCQFCPLKFGAFKKTNLDTWIHVICADFFNSICVNVGSQVCIDKSRLPDKNPCSLCVSENGFIGYTRACGGGCNKYFHITCAQISGTLAIKKLKLTQEKKLYRVYCKHHKVKYNNRSSLTFRKPFSYECYSDYSKIQNLNSNCLMLDENDVSKFKLSNFESGSIKSSNNGLTNIDASSTPRLTIEKINQIFNNIPGHIESSFNETIDSNKFGDDEVSDEIIKLFALHREVNEYSKELENLERSAKYLKKLNKKLENWKTLNSNQEPCTENDNTLASFTNDKLSTESLESTALNYSNKEYDKSLNNIHTFNELVRKNGVLDSAEYHSSPITSNSYTLLSQLSSANLNNSKIASLSSNTQIQPTWTNHCNIQTETIQPNSTIAEKLITKPGIQFDSKNLNLNLECQKQDFNDLNQSQLPESQKFHQMQQIKHFKDYLNSKLNLKTPESSLNPLKCDLKEIVEIAPKPVKKISNKVKHFSPGENLVNDLKLNNKLKNVPKKSRQSKPKKNTENINNGNNYIDDKHKRMSTQLFHSMNLDPSTFEQMANYNKQMNSNCQNTNKLVQDFIQSDVQNKHKNVDSKPQFHSRYSDFNNKESKLSENPQKTFPEPLNQRHYTDLSNSIPYQSITNSDAVFRNLQYRQNYNYFYNVQNQNRMYMNIPNMSNSNFNPINTVQTRNNVTSNYHAYSNVYNQLYRPRKKSTSKHN